MVTLAIVLCANIAMGNSFTKFCICIMPMLILLCAVVYSQVAHATVKPLPLMSNYSEYKEKTSRVKWTWQLPEAVRTTFYQSSYGTWFIEKIVRYEVSGNTVFRFYVNNGSLLDSDHYDSFLRTAYLDIVHNQTTPFTDK